MPRAHLYRPITDSAGNVVPNTKVTIYEAGTNQLLLQPLYVNQAGSLTRTNPWTTSDGYLEFYLDRPQTVRIGLSVQGSTETFTEDVSVLPPPENLVLADIGFQIVNAPSPGYFLQSGQAGIAAWVDAADVINSKPTPLNTIKQYDWSGGVLDDAVLSGLITTPTPTFPDVSADTKPTGWSFTKALATGTADTVTVRAPAQNFVETGSVIFLYKVISANGGVGAARLRASIDNDLLYVDTPTSPDALNTWLVGYLDEVPVGSHRLSLVHTPGADLSSQVLIGPVWMEYGNNIPAHEHPGTASNTLRIGTGSLADYAGATVVGSAARALDQNATAFGFGAAAGLNGLAVGAGASAAADSVALGQNAGSAPDKTGWLAVGKDSSVSDSGAVALGPRTKAQGANSVAVGPDAKTGVVAEAIAIGSGAQALGLRSVAIGRGATVAPEHSYSVAIGPGAVTTADRQAVIGDSQTTVVVPGALRSIGGEATFGGPTSKLGFYGSTGITRPTVLGSRAGNTTLAQLLSALATMGLITDGTTA